jgi:hypothetical protein
VAQTKVTQLAQVTQAFMACGFLARLNVTQKMKLAQRWRTHFEGRV